MDRLLVRDALIEFAGASRFDDRSLGGLSRELDLAHRDPADPCNKANDPGLKRFLAQNG